MSGPISGPMPGPLFFLIKVAVSAVIVAVVSEIAKRWPGWGGLVSAMPLTTLLALVWTYAETRDMKLAENFTRSVLLGVFPTLFFFLAALFLFRRHLPFALVLGLSFAVYLAAAFVHRLILPDA